MRPAEVPLPSMCAGPSGRPPLLASRLVLVAVVIVTACAPAADPGATTTADAAPTMPRPGTSTTRPPTTTTEPSSPSSTWAEDAGMRVLFAIPVGGSGVTYEGGFEDWEVDGPQALAVGSDGSVWVADTGARRLLRFSGVGDLLVDVDTDTDGVAGLIDLAAVGDGVWGLEIVPALDRQRILLFDGSGGLVSEHELPPGLHLSDGLSGIAAGPDGRLWIELEGGARLYEAFDDTGAFAPHQADGYELGGVVVGPLPSGEGGRIARFGMGDAIIERRVREQGGLSFEGATSDRIVLLLADVAFGADGAIDVALDALVTDRAGVVVATAAYPLDEVAASAYVPNELLAVAPDGRLLALVPAADRLDVVELIPVQVTDG